MDYDTAVATGANRAATIFCRNGNCGRTGSDGIGQGTDHEHQTHQPPLGLQSPLGIAALLGWLSRRGARTRSRVRVRGGLKKKTERTGLSDFARCTGSLRQCLRDLASAVAPWRANPLAGSSPRGDSRKKRSGRDYRASPDARFRFGDAFAFLRAPQRRGARTRSRVRVRRGLSKKTERTGLEPATSAVTGRRSNQLNYRSNGKAGDRGKNFPEPARLASGTVDRKAGTRNKKCSGKSLLSERFWFIVSAPAKPPGLGSPSPAPFSRTPSPKQP